MALSRNVSIGRVRLISDPEAYEKSFARFPGDQLNGWIPEKVGYCGKEGQVVRLFSDRTVTIRFDDGVQMDFPFESIEEQISSATVPDISLGRVRLISDSTEYENSFARFTGDQLNGWIPAKVGYCGKEGQVVKLFADQTVTIRFDDGVQLDFPYESIAEQLSLICTPKKGEVWRVADIEGFKERFHRFVGDELNYWSEEKDRKRGSCGIVLTVYGDQTVTMLFEDMIQFDFPFEALNDAPDRNVDGFTFNHGTSPPSYQSVNEGFYLLP